MSRWFRVSGAMVAVLLGAVACSWLTSIHRGPVALVVPTYSRSGFNAYAASRAYDTVHLRVDKQLLTDATLHNTGPLAEIQPDADAYKTDSTALYAGALLARIIVHPDTIPFNSYSYGHYAISDTGVVYWFVRHNRSYFVPRDTTQPIDSSMTLDLGMTHGENWKESLARWQWSATDELPWVTCDKNRCCYAQ